jgi:hypothetical protein
LDVISGTSDGENGGLVLQQTMLWILSNTCIRGLNIVSLLCDREAYTR